MNLVLKYSFLILFLSISVLQSSEKKQSAPAAADAVSYSEDPSLEDILDEAMREFLNEYSSNLEITDQDGRTPIAPAEKELQAYFSSLRIAQHTSRVAETQKYQVFADTLKFIKDNAGTESAKLQYMHILENFSGNIRIFQAAFRIDFKALRILLSFVEDPVEFIQHARSFYTDLTRTIPTFMNITKLEQLDKLDQLQKEYIYI